MAFILLCVSKNKSQEISNNYDNYSYEHLFVSNIISVDKMSSTAKNSGFMDVIKIGYVILGILVILLALAAAIQYYSTASFSGITAISASSGIIPLSLAPLFALLYGQIQKPEPASCSLNPSP